MLKGGIIGVRILNEDKDFTEEFVKVHFSRHNAGKIISKVTSEDSLLFVINSRLDVANDKKPIE
jgi:hypothetical protein